MGCEYEHCSNSCGRNIVSLSSRFIFLLLASASHIISEDFYILPQKSGELLVRCFFPFVTNNIAFTILVFWQIFLICKRKILIISFSKTRGLCQHLKITTFVNYYLYCLSELNHHASQNIYIITYFRLNMNPQLWLLSRNKCQLTFSSSANQCDYFEFVSLSINLHMPTIVFYRNFWEVTTLRIMLILWTFSGDIKRSQLLYIFCSTYVVKKL